MRFIRLKQVMSIWDIWYFMRHCDRIKAGYCGGIRTSAKVLVLLGRGVFYFTCFNLVICDFLRLNEEAFVHV